MNHFMLACEMLYGKIHVSMKYCLRVSNYKHGDGNSRISGEHLRIFSFRGLSDATLRPLKEPSEQCFGDSVPTSLVDASIPTLYPLQPFIFKSRMLHMYVCM